MTLIDTNVLIDLVTDDPAWANWSLAQLQGSSGDTISNSCDPIGVLWKFWGFGDTSFNFCTLGRVWTKDQVRDNWE